MAPHSRQFLACLHISAVGTLLMLLLLPHHGSAVECFVCSYAPRSNSSRMDGCTETNFTDIVIDTRTCDFGCERVASFDVNGELESYHRNCAHQETQLTNTCETHDTVVLTKIVCACDYNYCNSSPALATNMQLVCLLAGASYLWQLVSRRSVLTRHTSLAYRNSARLLLSSPP